MKIYGQTNDIIVREMTKSDCEKFRGIMTENKDDFTIEEVRGLWAFRKRDGQMQCTVTSLDGSVVYGFGGVALGKQSHKLFDEYIRYGEQIEKILEKLRISADNIKKQS